MEKQQDYSADSHLIGQRLREEIARRRISRQALADMAQISLSTLEKAMVGSRPFTLTTLIRIEEALNIQLRPKAPEVSQSQQAPDQMGAYSRAAVRWIEGRYLALRPSFSTADAIYCYIVSVQWSNELGHLAFAESERLDASYGQRGYVSMPSLSGHIYLVTNDGGQHRMMILGRPTIDGAMYGILSTLEVGHGSQLVPAAAPIALLNLDRVNDPEIGNVAQGSPKYAECRAILSKAIEGDYLRFHC